ncbi:hypothetical protein SAY86_020869, partial [Trapa natans]
ACPSNIAISDPQRLWLSSPSVVTLSVNSFSPRCLAHLIRLDRRSPMFSGQSSPPSVAREILAVASGRNSFLYQWRMVLSFDAPIWSYAHLFIVMGMLNSSVIPILSDLFN